MTERGLENTRQKKSSVMERESERRKKLVEKYTEVGDTCTYLASSSKVGCGVKNLRDRNPQTFWQSNGEIPHVITLRFPGLTSLSFISICVEYQLDESYTPSEIVVSAGTNFYDISVIKKVDIPRSDGWVDVALADPLDATLPLTAGIVQLAVTENHQDGNDSHIRGLEVWSQKGFRKILKSLGEEVDPRSPKMPTSEICSTVEFDSLVSFR